MTLVELRNSTLIINVNNIVLFEKENDENYSVLFCDGTRLHITAEEYATLTE